MNRIRMIGQGGFGIVELYQTNDGHQYAVKQMINNWDENHYERFKREVILLKNLVHRNIVKVLNYDIDNNNPWYVMPYYKDGSLRDKLLDMKSKGQSFSIQGATGIIYYLAEAMGYAHSFGKIHRDLKPENILFDGKEPIIADWGIGKFIHKESKLLTNAGLGSKLYCSPEQWESGESDCRSDIYSLGVMYRELVTGQVSGYVNDNNVNLIITKMTMFSPLDRYQNMDELLKDIKSLNIVSSQPLNDFWNGAIKLVAVAGLVYVLAKILGD